MKHTFFILYEFCVCTLYSPGIKCIKTENALNLPRTLCQFVSPMAMGDKLQGQVIQHIPLFSSWGFCCNCQQESEIANSGGAGFCGVNDYGQQPGLGPEKPFHVYSHESSKGKSLRLLLAWMRFKQTISMWRTHYPINS